MWAHVSATSPIWHTKNQEKETQTEHENKGKKKIQLAYFDHKMSKIIGETCKITDLQSHICSVKGDLLHKHAGKPRRSNCDNSRKDNRSGGTHEWIDGFTLKRAHSGIWQISYLYRRLLIKLKENQNLDWVIRCSRTWCDIHTRKSRNGQLPHALLPSHYLAPPLLFSWFLTH